MKISAILQSIKLPFSKEAITVMRELYPASLDAYQVIRKGNTSFRLWQAGGGYDRNIYSPKGIEKTMDYIHNNPVIKGLCKVPEDYPWSSAGFWLDGRKTAIEMDVPPWW